uniref:Uncharacterized protein n=1 Tax=Triticum urartu TaxID=4572 RepID=A0A8R7PT21_TRIUA
MMHCRILCSLSLEMTFPLVFFLPCVTIGFCSYTQNESLTLVFRYECAINIEDLIKLSDVMSEHSL